MFHGSPAHLLICSSAHLLLIVRHEMLRLNPDVSTRLCTFRDKPICDSPKVDRFVDRADRDCFSRHTKDDATRLVLRNRKCTFVL
jgi:hypothetical protein